MLEMYLDPNKKKIDYNINTYRMDTNCESVNWVS